MCDVSHSHAVQVQSTDCVPYYALDVETAESSVLPARVLSAAEEHRAV